VFITHINDVFAWPTETSTCNCIFKKRK